MTEESPKTLSPSEFVCGSCGRVAQIRRDWQRCWPCCLKSATRDLQTIPGICYDCHLRKHRR